MRTIKAFDTSFAGCMCPGVSGSIRDTRTIGVAWRHAFVTTPGGGIASGWEIRCQRCGTRWFWRRPSRPGVHSPGGVRFEELAEVRRCGLEVRRPKVEP